jgi:hypothetical protein
MDNAQLIQKILELKNDQIRVNYEYGPWDVLYHPSLEERMNNRYQFFTDMSLRERIKCITAIEQIESHPDCPHDGFLLRSVRCRP